MGYKHVVPPSLIDRIVADIKAYRKEHNCGDGTVAKAAGMAQSLISRYRKGEGKPSLKSIIKLVEGGVTNVVLPEELRKRAVERVLVKVDKGNMPPRAYRRNVVVPPIIANQAKLLLDDYMKSLRQPRTYDEFQQEHEEFVKKMYFLCRQG